ncbi:Cobalt transporter subunit (CbtB) [Frankia sp. AiPs1]|uniref:CbtB domain-containing protein n=1 Tax=Frankia sp. AiPa1 TaxID=573492 RepID=UPI00202AC503|nr:CbtB-domain containing protein [Frankia sp. AiPa1]MCL9760491.1 CbtB-domain containing protein [Frankia sp. AiPa1]
MTTPAAESRQRAIALPLTARHLALGLTALLSLALLYFIGVDQGATSLFGSDTHIHEFVHDARHFLGFPCH